MDWNSSIFVICNNENGESFEIPFKAIKHFFEYYTSLDTTPRHLLTYLPPEVEIHFQGEMQLLLTRLFCNIFLI